MDNNTICLNILACTLWRLERTKDAWQIQSYDIGEGNKSRIEVLKRQLSRKNWVGACQSINLLYISEMPLKTITPIRKPVAMNDAVLFALLKVLQSNVDIRNALQKLEKF